MESEDSRPSELEALLVDDGEEAIDRKLRSALEPFVSLTRDGRLVTKREFLGLSHQNRLLVALLARQAMVRLKLRGVVAEADPETLYAECLVPLKSSREHLSRLKSERLLEKNERGYFVPIWALDNATSILQKHP